MPVASDRRTTTLRVAMFLLLVGAVVILGLTAAGDSQPVLFAAVFILLGGGVACAAMLRDARAPDTRTCRKCRRLVYERAPTCPNCGEPADW